MINVQEITTKKIWEDFLTNAKDIHYPLFQSWNWGEVQKKLGFSVLRVGVFNNKKLVAICQIIDINARRGHYFHLRHGPVLKPFNPAIFDALMSYIKTQAQQKNVSFIRLNPLVERKDVPQEFLTSRGMRNAPLHNMDAEICWILDITKSEDELLKQMRKSHRYLLKKALAESALKTIKTTDLTDIQKFLPLYKNLSKRKHFVPHKGVTEEFDVFKKDNQSMLILVEYNKKVIAGGLFDFVGDMAIYRHSASNEEYRNIPAMYLLLWEAIKESKKRNLKVFNFWGIAPNDSKNHPWAGLTLFKTGFGGEKKEFLHAQDMPLGLSYWKTYGIELASKILKGY